MQKIYNNCNIGVITNHLLTNMAGRKEKVLKMPLNGTEQAKSMKLVVRDDETAMSERDQQLAMVDFPPELIREAIEFAKTAKPIRLLPFPSKPYLPVTTKSKANDEIFLKLLSRDVRTSQELAKERGNCGPYKPQIITQRSANVAKSDFMMNLDISPIAKVTRAPSSSSIATSSPTPVKNDKSTIMNKNNVQLGQLSPSTQLFSAAESGNAKRVKELLASHGPSVFNSRSFAGNTALYVAFINRHSETVDLILDAIQATSTFTNISNSMGLTYLHIACTRQNEKVIQGFLDAKANIEDTVNKNAPRWAGYNAMHFAANFQSLPALKILLKAGMKRSSKTCSGKTALDLLNEGLIDPLIMVDFLEDKSPTKRNFSNFQIACMNESKTAIQKFIDHGAANVNSTIHHELSVAFDSSPLHCAVASKSKDKVEFLLQRGAKIERSDIKTRTPLHLALYGFSELDAANVAHQNVKILELLYAAVEDKFNNIKDSNGLTFFHAAIACNDLPTIKEYLMEGEADVNKPLLSSAGQFANYTPLHMAVYFRRFEAAELLIEWGADVNVCDKRDGTPLHLAFYFQCYDFIELLMSKTRLEIITPKNQETMLHLLAELVSFCSLNFYNKLSKESITMYFEQVAKLGVNVNAKNVRGDTALHCFHSQLPQWATYFQMLLDLGADINTKNNEGELPFNSTEWIRKDAKYKANAIFYQHVQKLKALGLKVDPENDETCKLIVSCFEKGELNCREQQRLEEIAKLKSMTVGDATSLYNFIKLDSERTVLYADCATLKDIALDKDLKRKFPSYGYLIQLKYREATGFYDGAVAKKRHNCGVDRSIACKRQRVE